MCYKLTRLCISGHKVILGEPSHRQLRVPQSFQKIQSFCELFLMLPLVINQGTGGSSQMNAFTHKSQPRKGIGFDWLQRVTVRSCPCRHLMRCSETCPMLRSHYTVPIDLSPWSFLSLSLSSHSHKPLLWCGWDPLCIKAALNPLLPWPQMTMAFKGHQGGISCSGPTEASSGPKSCSPNLWEGPRAFQHLFVLPELVNLESLIL